MLPPRWLRRVVLAPLVPLGTVFLLTSLPLLAIAAAAVSPRLPGRWRPLRLLWFVLVLLVVESLGLVIAALLWLGSGFGWKIDHPRMRAAHHLLIKRYLAVVVHTAERAFHMRLVLRGAVAADDVVRDGRPLIVLSRHAGPGDSVLLVHELVTLGYRPRLVLKGSLQWAPLLDVILNRVPSSFVGPRGRTGAEEVGRLATGMGPREALLIFPEGGNFTEQRRLHSIARLEELGDHQAAEQARALRHVLAPRPGGALMAMRAAPQAHVVLVAHTGLEELSGLVDLWRGLPMDSSVEARAWRVAPEELPAGDDEREAWLYAWWRRIDAWILERRGPELVPDDVVEQSADVAPAPDPDS